MSWWHKYKVSIPEGRSGDWAVERFEVSKEESRMDQLRCMFSGSGRYCRPGRYTRLVRGRVVVMSDTADEIRDHLGPIQEVQHAVRRGEEPTCLVHGLGIGMVAKAMLDEGARSVVVIEQSGDVINLVGRHLIEQVTGEDVQEGHHHPHAKGHRVLTSPASKLTIIEADALHWQPPRGSRWDVVWHDIWDTICADNLDDMKQLHRRFGRRSVWQGSWARKHCERLRDEGW